MAIARGAGTEIIRAHHYQTVNSTSSTLIVGVQHHIYTVLSIIVYCWATQTAGTNEFICEQKGYDAKTLVTGHTSRVFDWIMVVDDTFVWNDKFSMNGFAGAQTTSAMNTAAEQDIVADQAGTLNILNMRTTHASDSIDVTITFLDQNNA